MSTTFQVKSHFLSSPFLLTAILILFALDTSRLQAFLLVDELTPSEKESLSLACDHQTQKELCYKKQLLGLEHIGRVGDLLSLHIHEQQALNNGCFNTFAKGPAVYAHCIKKELKRWNSSNRVKLAKLEPSVQEELRTTCDDSWNAGLPQFNFCMIRELPHIITRPTPPTDDRPDNATDQRGPTQETPRSPEELFRSLSPSIVFITASNPSDSKHSTGSGVAVTTSIVITNYHIIEGKKNILITDGDRRHRSTVLWADIAKDMCILKVSTTSLKPIRSRRVFAQLKIGETVYTLGNPKGLEKTFSDGMISGKRFFEGQPLIQVTAPMTYGSSGGGLFDKHGQLIGITTAGYDEGNIGFAIPIDEYMNAMN